MFTYKTVGTCSAQINFDVDSNDVVTFVEFIGGCPGNAKGVGKLVVGMKVDDVIEKLKGIPCRGTTSCPDQLSRALTSYKDQNKN